MELELLEPPFDRARLRGFLAAIDPEDYLLEDLDDWSRDGRLWVGREGPEWVAFGRLHDLGRGDGWLSGLRVRPDRRGRGIGTALTRALLADARTLGLGAVRAVVDDRNAASRAIFASLGFRAEVALALRRGRAADGDGPRLARAGPSDRPDGPVGWLPASEGIVDRMPGTEGGRFARWDPTWLVEWAATGKLYLAPGLAVAVQPDWWAEPRTLWANPLRGEPGRLFPALGALAGALGHEEWQAFLPSTERTRAEYGQRGLLPHPRWGDRVHLFVRTVD